MTKQPQMKYNPSNGLRFIAENWTATSWRKYWPERKWIYNPYTGKTREPDDVIADPMGEFVAQPAEAA